MLSFSTVEVTKKMPEQSEFNKAISGIRNK